MLADFGIARWVGEHSALTGTNMTVGTVAYCAPEQLKGEEIDGRADQYALAAAAFQLLTGAPPFQHSNPAVVISQHLTADPPKIGARRPELSGPNDEEYPSETEAPVLVCMEQTGQTRVDCHDDILQSNATATATPSS